MCEIRFILVGMIEHVFSLYSIGQCQMIETVENWTLWIAIQYYDIQVLPLLDPSDIWEFLPKLLQAEWTSHSISPYSAHIRQNPKIISKIISSILFTFLVSTLNVHSCLSSAFGRSYKMCQPIRRFESENILFHDLESNVHSFKMR